MEITTKQIIQIGNLMLSHGYGFEAARAVSKWVGSTLNLKQADKLIGTLRISDPELLDGDEVDFKKLENLIK